VRVLLDECVPRRLKRKLLGHEVSTVVEMGWSGVKNGKLIALAAADFDCFLTVDANIQNQQNLAAIPVAILLVRAVSNDPDTLIALVPEVLAALNAIQPKTFAIVPA
jgi:predicted nuclease of predicted toxin-antitoxin system